MDSMKIFNITVPQKSDLTCALCKIINSENDPLIYSDLFYAKKLKCRQFLQETLQGMAAPVVSRKILEAGGSIYIIVAKELFENYTFHDHCDALNIQMMEILDLIPTHVYKACLLYTMEYKLAPQWNKVGLYLVEGPNFLSSTGSVNAIILNIKENCDNSSRIQVEAVNLKIPFLRLDTTRPSQYDEEQPRVRVLPSMRVANVLRISKIIKEKHLFKDYEDLRAYWKNMYGYILPDYEEGLLFYDIQFFYLKSTLIYPETCLTSGPLKILPPTMDPTSIIYKFVGDLKARVVKLCGQQLDICPENTYQAAILAYTPILPRIGRFSTRDTGYNTQSRRINSVTPLSQRPDTCDIPTKRTRLSLSKTNDFLTCENNDLDLAINPTCSTSKFKPLKIADKISAMLCDADSVVASKSIALENKSKSHYFEQNKQEPKNESSVELSDEGKILSLKEKLLRNF